MVADGTRHTNPTGFRQRFEPCGDIHTVAMNVVVRDDYVPEVDTDAELDALVVRDVSVPFSHTALHGYRAGDCLYDAWEFDQQTVAGCLDDAALVFGDRRFDKFAPMRSEPCEGAGLVEPHEAAIASNIGGKNGREPALDPLCAQRFLPTRRPDF
jgi:hypothetical protein